MSECLFAALSGQHIPERFINLPRAICCGLTKTIEGHAALTWNEGPSKVIFSAHCCPKRCWRKRCPNGKFELLAWVGSFVPAKIWLMSVMLMTCYCTRVLGEIWFSWWQICNLNYKNILWKWLFWSPTKIRMQLCADVAGDMVDILAGKATHKYFGKVAPVSLKQRILYENEDRICIA